MQENTWRDAKRIFEGLVEGETQERVRVLDTLEREQPELARLVRELLAADAQDLELSDLPSKRGPVPAASAVVREPDPDDPYGWAGLDLADYRLVRSLGSGGMGVVYEATQRTPSRRVAIKTLRPGLLGLNQLERFRFETEALARLSHPGITRVYEVGVWEPPGLLGSGVLPFLAMELVEGAVEIGSWVEAEPRSLEARLELFLEVCDAVQHGHQKGVLHRDIKPQNVLVDGSGRVKVIDFGIARGLLPEDQLETRLTQQGNVLGTIRYMSPEQLEGRVDAIDTRTDVYALGVLLYELLTGQHPFSAGDDSLASYVRRITTTVVPQPSRTPARPPAELDWVVLRALEREPADRFDSVADLAGDVRRWIRHEPLQARPPSALYRARKFVRRHRLAVGAGLALLLSIGAGSVSTWFSMRDARTAWAAEEVKSALAEERLDLARQELGRARWTSRLVHDMFFAATPERKGRSVKVVDFLAEASRGLEASPPDGPDLEALMATAIGALYSRIGLLEEAERHLGRAHALARETDRLRPFERAEIGMNLLRHFAATGDFARAEALIAELELVFASEDPAEMGDASLADLLLQMREIRAVLRYRSGDCVRGLAELGELAEEQARRRGSLAIETLKARFNRASGWLHCRQTDRALEEMQALLPLLESAGGADRVLGRQAAASFAVALARSGGREGIEEALGVFDELERSYAKLYGSEDPRTLFSRLNRLGLLNTLGRLEESALLVDGLEDACVAAFGPASDPTLTAMNNIGGYLGRTGRHDEALDLTLRRLERVAAGPGERSMAGAAAFDTLGAVYLNLGRPEEAIPAYQEALSIHEENATSAIAVAAERLERALRRAGRAEEARALGETFGLGESSGRSR